jgi:hypothetical protein
MPTLRYGSKPPKIAGVPQFKLTRLTRTTPPTPKSLSDQWRMTQEPKTWDIGAGPWSYQGKKASRPEYLCLKVLQQLGWRPDFQTDFAGGRKLPGGQVLDIVVNEHFPPVYINVMGFYHFGAAKNFNDFIKEATVRAVMPMTKIIDVWETQVDQPHYLETLFAREIGYAGRGR